MEEDRHKGTGCVGLHSINDWRAMNIHSVYFVDLTWFWGQTLLGLLFQTLEARMEDNRKDHILSTKFHSCHFTGSEIIKLLIAKLQNM
jgi:hypothetical protein